MRISSFNGQILTLSAKLVSLLLPTIDELRCLDFHLDLLLQVTLINLIIKSHIHRPRSIGNLSLTFFLFLVDVQTTRISFVKFIAKGI
jgi:hypothetical protein